MKYSFCSLIPFLPLFCNCQFRSLDSVEFLCSQVRNLAGSVSELDSSVLDYSCSVLNWLKNVKVKPTLRLTVGQYVLVSSHIWGSWPHIYYCSDSYGLVFMGRPLWREGGVYLLYVYMVLALASAVFLVLGSESLGTRDHILLSQIWDFPFRRILRLAGSRWIYLNPPPPVSQSVSNTYWLKRPSLSLYKSSARTTQKTASLLLRRLV
jgi:hypothetical protein